MGKYELSITKDYAPDWNVVDAVREFFQNALDQQTVNELNPMFWDYENGTFKIGNAKSVLKTKSLLLGASTKAEDNETIGQFGEGYKIATLVLTRLGKKVTIYNYGAKEVWTADIEYSKKYDSELLVFTVDKKYPWNKVPDNDLTITIEGITEDEYDDILKSNLHMKHYEYIDGEKGEVLLDIELRGKMFVNGLYINEVQDFQYGYNFHPTLIKLDRDRKLIRQFDLQWASSELWGKLKGEDAVKMLKDLVKVGAPDVKYLTSVNTYSTLQVVSNSVKNDFTNKYGLNAVPVTTQEEADKLEVFYKPIIVNSETKKLIETSDNYVEPTKVYIPTLLDKVELWLTTHGGNIKREAKRQLQAIINEEKNKDKEEYPF